MKVRPGIGYATAAGSVAGLTALPTRNGLVLRNRILTPQRQTTNVEGVRRSFAAMTALWKTLTDEQRRRWNERAPEPLTGFNWFVKTNLRLSYSLLSAVLVPPPEESGIIPSLSVGPINVATSSIPYTINANWITNTLMVITATNLWNSSKSVFTGCAHRRVSTQAVTLTGNWWTAYSNAWRTPTTSDIGKRMEWCLYAIRSDGRVSETVRQIVTVA
jgi:hypothetical protein